MNIDQSGDWKVGLPDTFTKLLEDYGYPMHIKDYGALELITVWRAAIAAYKSDPDCSNEIAIHTMSFGCDSELTDTDDRFTDIYFTFGELEVPAYISDEGEWEQLEKDIEDLAREFSE